MNYTAKKRKLVESALLLHERLYCQPDLDSKSPDGLEDHSVPEQAGNLRAKNQEPPVACVIPSAK